MTFNKVNFSYDEDTPVLKDVSFNIPPGEKLAIVGPTGSGKSTLIRLLSRFYDFDDNLIHLDGIDLNKILSKDLRSRVGVVLQDFHIFSGSILDNLTLGNPRVSEEKAETVLLIQDALRKLPLGRTSIIIAHRLQTIQEADRVMVMDKGQIAEIGSHEELIEAKGLYYTLHNLQFQEGQQTT